VSGVETDIRSFMLFTFRGRRVVRIDNILHEHDVEAAVGSPSSVTERCG
jgi:hypothetical protein